MHRRHLAAWAQQAAKPDWKPSFLDDLFLHNGDPAPRESFMVGLNWLEGHSIQQHSHPFVPLTTAQQTGLLQSLDAATGPSHDFFQCAKLGTAGIYYNTQIGYQELNKGGRVPATFGCTHESHA